MHILPISLTISHDLALKSNVNIEKHVKYYPKCVDTISFLVDQRGYNTGGDIHNIIKIK